MSTHDEKTFERDLGQKATVRREEIAGDGADFVRKANIDLIAIGGDINETPSLKALEYQGSIAVHIYVGHGMQEMHFVEQTTTLMDTHKNVANAAITALSRAVERFYTGRAAKKRSGF